MRFGVQVNRAVKTTTYSHVEPRSVGNFEISFDVSRQRRSDDKERDSGSDETRHFDLLGQRQLPANDTMSSDFTFQCQAVKSRRGYQWHTLEIATTPPMTSIGLER